MSDIHVWLSSDVLEHQLFVHGELQEECEETNISAQTAVCCVIRVMGLQWARRPS